MAMVSRRGVVAAVGLTLSLVSTLRAQQSTTSPHGDLKMACATCHIATGWTPVRVAREFDHARFGFALTGAHGTTTCRACHHSLDFKGVEANCVSCHEDRHRGELGASCARCHTTRSFLDRELMVNAHRLTRFPLQGGHLSLDCASCHKPGAQGSMQFVGTQTECVACHREDYNSAPNHVASSFPTGCSECHGQIAWGRGIGMAGSHPASPIALTGVHANRQCADCHLAGQPYGAVLRTCDGCHHSDYAGAQDPDHAGAGFSINCTDCHRLVAGWTGATFASHPRTPIDPKQTAHAAATCKQCHTASPYSAVAQTCDGCHHSTYVAVTDPNHQAIGMTAFAAANCSNCHSTTRSSWTGPTWTHMSILNPQRVRLPHEGASCADCHQTATNYTIKSCAKSGCHRNATGP